MSLEQAPTPGAASRHRMLARLRLITVLGLTLAALALLTVAAYLYRQTFAEAQRALGAASRVAQEHALKMLETNEMLLARMLDLLGNARDSELTERGVELHARLKRMASELPQVQGLFVHGADSRSLVTSVVHPAPAHIDYSDREWYVAQRDGRGAPVFITEQLKSRATGEAFFDMSRRRLIDGSFAGTVNVSLRPEYLTAFYKEIAASAPGLQVTVLRLDGRLLARWPAPVLPGAALPPDDPIVRQIAAGVAAGTLDVAARGEDGQRLVSFRRLGEYPLYVATAFPRRQVLADWGRRVVLLSLFVVPMGCAFAWMAWLGLQRTREELEAVQRLEEETVRRQRSEVALAHAQKLEAMGRLTGGVAHDFNNLLMVFVNNVHLLRRLYPQIEGSAQIGAIERALDTGTRLTRQLLAFSRRQALKPERIVLQQRLDALLTLLETVLPSSMQLAGRVAPDTGAIRVDAAELELALINLVLNARDAMEQTGGRIDLYARNALPGELDTPGEFVVIEVNDTGCGIDPQIVDRVLEPFFTTKPAGKGSGLGLSQVLALCQTAGGTVRIDAPADRGTRVRMFFERDVGSPAATAERAVAAPPTDLSCALLLVEDNAELAEATGALLESFGCRVTRVANARAALDAIGRRPFDVVLSDIEMAGEMDGIGLAAALGERVPRVPVILITGYAERLDEAKRLDLEVLPKPCPPGLLGAALARALARDQPGIEVPGQASR